MLLPIPHVDLFPVPVGAPHIPRHSWSCGRLRSACGVPEKQNSCPSVAFNSSWESPTHTGENAHPKACFSSPVRKWFLPPRLASLSLHPKGFLPINLRFSPLTCQLRQEGAPGEGPALTMQSGVKHRSRDLHLSKSQARYGAGDIPEF